MNAQQRLLLNVELLVTNFVTNLTNGDRSVVTTPPAAWPLIDGATAAISANDLRALRRGAYCNARRRHRISLVLYVLAEIHRLVLTNDTCTLRELYYKNPLLSRNQRAIDNAVKDVCNIFHTIPWNLGIFASGKGLIAGPLRIHTTNGDIVDCNTDKGILLLPKMINTADRLVTSANFVLVVEKDTVFQKLLSQITLDGNPLNIIFITGKGFPDLSTRLLVKRLHVECALPIYVLVDADPYGVEIMLIYRHGSVAMRHSAEQLACPQVSWLGIHPSELDAMDIPTIPFTQRDMRKVVALQRSANVDAGVRRELDYLQRMQRKSRVEQVSPRALLHDYVINKIKRNLIL